MDAPDLNNLVDQAIALKGFIHTQVQLSTAADPVNDEVVIWDASVDDLRRAKLQALPSGVTSVSTIVDSGPAVLNFSVLHATSTPEFHIGLDNQAAGKFLAGPISGSAVTPGFRLIAPTDTILFNEVALHAIDCTLGNVFRKILHANENLKLNNGSLGQRITVYLIQGDAPGNFTVTWDSDDAGHVIRWPGGVDHTMTTGSLGRTDIVNFLCMGVGLYYGTYNKDFTP